MNKKILQMEPDFDKKEARALYNYMKRGGWATEFKETQEFEGLICKFSGAKFCIAVNNGTVALTLALIACGVSGDDEVIVPDLTMIATANAVLLAGARPVFVDVERKTLCLDIEKARKALNKKTRALIYVSLNGRTNDLSKVKKFCQENGLAFIEDAAQSFGSFYRGKCLGTYGQIGCFSFSPHKIITTGQGGALVTDNEMLASNLRKLKDFGREKGGYDIHDTIGYNFKFTDIQAVVGIEQMKKLKKRIKRKKEIYELYLKELSGLGEIEFIYTDLKQTCPWFVDIYIDNPDKLAMFLSREGIGTRRVYPPVNSQKAYNIQGSYPISEDYSSRGLWLPSSVKLKNSEIKYICRSIHKFYSF